MGYQSSRGVALGFLAVMLCLIAVVIIPEIGGKRYWREIQSPDLIIVTHNVKGFNFDPTATGQLLTASDADILVLQEWGPSMDGQRPLLRKTFPYNGSCGTAELQIFSRFPIGTTRCAPTAIGPAGQILVWAEIRIPSGQTVTVLTLHPTWRLSRYWREEGRKALIQFLKTMKPEYLIVAGDFNITPWNQGMRELDAGLAPLRRITRAQFTFPARARGISWPFPLLPIDHIFVGPGITDASVDRLARTGSDHYPLRMRLKLQPLKATKIDRRIGEIIQ